MSTTLETLRKFTTAVADTGDISQISKYQPQDATTNPSLILKAAQMPQYAPFIHDAIAYAKENEQGIEKQVICAAEHLAVNIGKEILAQIPGRISTEVDARLSYDLQACVDKGRSVIKMYQEAGIDKSRILIKLAATWQGICAAEILEKEGINCNLTLLFSFAQAQACAQANVYLISPFVGRIMDWHKAKENRDFSPQDDPGVKSVAQIYTYYKSHGFNTVVMGASFRNTGEIIELAGCDRLTISPALLEELAQTNIPLVRKLSPNMPLKPRPAPLTQAQFLWAHNMDAMAVEKLAEGIRQFAADQDALEETIRKQM